MAAPLRFSVGIPAFNQGDFLEQTILSLLSQTRPPDEIVVSDHYSTDNTPDVIAKYARHLRAVKPPEGCNLTGQYNFTLASQTGDWITLLSSDDIARPRYCEVLMGAAASQADAVLVRTGWENIDPTGKVLSRGYMLSAPRVEQPPATLTSQRNGPRVSFASFAIKREAYERSGPILDSLESLADWALFVQLAPFGSFVYVNDTLAGYRVGHDGNKFRRRLAMWIRDEQRMFGEVLPLAADRAGLTVPADRKWIAEASKENFVRYLASASDEYTTHEREQVAADFASWAEQVGCQALLRSFRDGRRIRRPGAIIHRTKDILRPFAQTLVARLRSR
jgi:glycosyltransferase involved in cell wall biosynthesis